MFMTRIYPMIHSIFFSNKFDKIVSEHQAKIYLGFYDFDNFNDRIDRRTVRINRNLDSFLKSGSLCKKFLLSVIFVAKVFAG